MTLPARRLCDLLGIQVPIVQAPIGPAASADLVAAVAEAGGLGLIAGSARGTEGLRDTIRAVRQLSQNAIGVNILNEFPADSILDEILAAKIPIVSFFWGLNLPAIARAKAAGLIVMQTIGSAAEVAPAVAAGVDVLVAQGQDAGGHVWGTVGTMALIPAVVDAAGDVPVIAAGGIADGRGLAAAICLGAAGVWLGSRFLAAQESAAHPNYVARLLAAKETDTDLSTLYDVGWPNAPSRALVNPTIAAWRAAGKPTSGARPGEGDLIAAYGDGRPIPRYFVDIPVTTTTGDVAAMALYAGQSAGQINQMLSAADIIQQMVVQAKTLLSGSLADWTA
jgi:NAD(P)H-dependent flavin oxidoreductase YrpB (nitropropane dioxygenase family)